MPVREQLDHHHVEQGGFTLVRKGSGFIALTGPGLTHRADGERLAAPGAAGEHGDVAGQREFTASVCSSVRSWPVRLVASGVVSSATMVTGPPHVPANQVIVHRRSCLLFTSFLLGVQ